MICALRGTGVVPHIAYHRLDLLSAIKRFLTLLVVNALWVSIAVVDIASAHVDGCA